MSSRRKRTLTAETIIIITTRQTSARECANLSKLNQLIYIFNYRK